MVTKQTFIVTVEVPGELERKFPRLLAERVAGIVGGDVVGDSQGRVPFVVSVERGGGPVVAVGGGGGDWACNGFEDG